MNEASLSDEIPHITHHCTSNESKNPVASTSHDHNYDDTPATSSTNDPCPLCGRYAHSIALVNKLDTKLHPCFPVPQLSTNEQTKRRINKLARSLTSEEMMSQVKEKEEHIKEKKEKSEK